MLNVVVSAFSVSVEAPLHFSHFTFFFEFFDRLSLKNLALQTALRYVFGAYTFCFSFCYANSSSSSLLLLFCLLNSFLLAVNIGLVKLGKKKNTNTCN